MSVQVPARPAQELASRQITETEAWSRFGVRVLVAGIAMLLIAIGLFVLGFAEGPGGAGPVTAIIFAVLLVIAAELAFRGLTSVVAGGAGGPALRPVPRTIRAPGLHWVNPFARRRPVSVRIRNLETAVAKVNDAHGNPIESQRWSSAGRGHGQGALRGQ